MNTTRAIPVETDVLVVGGGLAGLAAAVSAAASGADTLLLERGGVLGGNATQAFVHSFCGLFEPPREGKFVYANPGFTPWFAAGLRRYGGAMPPEVHGRVAVMPTFPPRLAEFAQSITPQFPSLSVMLNTRLTGLRLASETAETAPFHAEYVGPDGGAVARAKVVIDATGDASAGHRVGAGCEAPESDELQNATLIFRVKGANPAELAGYSRLKLSAAIAHGASRGELPADCDSVLVRPGERPDEAYISLNLPKWQKRPYAPLDQSFMQEYTRYAHVLAEALIGFLRSKMPGWSQLQLLAWPLRIGVRESRHLLGRYVMQEEDILEAARFSDAVARSSWPVELWRGHKGADFKYPNGVADIPLRALVSRTHVNLGMAGRCMSGTHTALGALRVLGTAMATGEAIGLAAARAADSGRTLAQVSATEVQNMRNQLMDKVFLQP
jgi:hypothetical protein